MRYWRLYPLLSIAAAVSVGPPAFLLARRLQLAASRSSSFPAPRAGARLAQMTDIDTLPPDLSRFVGRARELREIAVLVVPGRFVTLLGRVGCGKTRLAAPAVIERWRRAGR
ncbi:winged helix family transcriptional regulator [Rhodococcus wratislaviensis IFP 2016]|nr:winged helix family transcriptional regulator [Rhodococcus wratislaviensis IFP 2016]MBC2898090.1 hypothetical protein [Rhodococcus sp. 4CII]